jgi:hypothetical protein
VGLAVVSVRGGKAWVWASPAVLAFSCADPEPLIGELVARGAHVELWASEGLEVCGGNVEHMDAFVDRFREVVGPRPEAEPMRRYHVLDADDWEDWIDSGRCRPGAGGCTAQRRTVYARLVPSTHELVHAEISASRHHLFEEGIAAVYGEGRPTAWPGFYDITDAIDLGAGMLPFEAYERAAHFSRFLIDRHGIDGFLSVRDATARGDGWTALDRAFHAALGASLDDEIEAYERFTPWCVRAGYQVALVECGLPASPWRNERSFEETVDLTCTNDDVLGPYEDEAFVLRSFEITARDEYAIEVDAEGLHDARVWIVKCGSRCRGFPGDDPAYPYEPPQIAFEVSAGEPQARTLYPGKYWLRFSRPVESVGEVTLRIEGQRNE